MNVRRFVIALVVALLALPAGSAVAKSPSYIIAGGELGAYAYQFYGITESGEWVEELPGSDAREVDAPQPLPSLAYDLYQSGGTLSVPYQLANGGPKLRYYPEAQMIHERSTGRWFSLSLELAAFLDASTEDALALGAKGQLEVGPIAADFRARHLFEMTYTVSPGGGVLSGAEAEAFVRQLIETVSRSPRVPTDESRSLTINLKGKVNGTGYGGVLGFYTPPADGRRGRFWSGGYAGDDRTPYYFATTEGLDSVISKALATAASPEGLEGPAAPTTAVTEAGA